MTTIAIAVGVLVIAGLIAMTLEAAPNIIAARAQARHLRDHGQAIARAAIPGYTAEEVHIALMALARRVDPDLPDELVERFAQTVGEDLEHGVLPGLHQDQPHG